jgi:hypothetical protein
MNEPESGPFADGAPMMGPDGAVYVVTGGPAGAFRAPDDQAHAASEPVPADAPEGCRDSAETREAVGSLPQMPVHSCFSFGDLPQLPGTHCFSFRDLPQLPGTLCFSFDPGVPASADVPLGSRDRAAFHKRPGDPRQLPAALCFSF